MNSSSKLGKLCLRHLGGVRYMARHRQWVNRGKFKVSIDNPLYKDTFKLVQDSPHPSVGCEASVDAGASEQRA